ncbi:hypothetical protein HY490_03095, partial [Candidatus Woesearchaeota archaeon]|nr:hypothetical protein [Candidatus Woesearchaeota archaeon]
SITRFAIWPNVYQTVQELRPLPLFEVVNSVGGTFLVGISIITLGWITFQNQPLPRKIILGILLLWTIGMMYASTKGVRFLLLLVPPLSLGYGLCAGMALSRIRQRTTGPIAVRVWQTLAVISAFAVILVSQQVQGAYSVVRGDEPFYHAAWDNILNTIQQSSLPDAIITSWWDYGHLFTYGARRPVTADGGSQHRSATYWTARFFTTSNETEAMNILRMLDCGSNHAYDVLENTTRNSLTAYRILEQLLPANTHDATVILQKEGIDPAAVLPLIKCTPPQAFVIVSGDMIFKSGAWGPFGMWNVTRALTTQLASGKPPPQAVADLVQHLNWTTKEAEEEYERIAQTDNIKEYISPLISYDETIGNCINDSEGLLCANGVRFNLANRTGKLIAANKPIPVVAPLPDGTLSVTGATGAETAYALLIPIGDRYESILASKPLATSMFAKLYFYRGLGLKHFKLLTWKPTLSQGAIFAYRVDWTGNQTTLIDNAFPEFGASRRIQGKAGQ